MDSKSRFELYVDGACTVNLGGTASFGYYLLKDDKEIDFGYGIIGSGAKMNSILAECFAISQGLASFYRHWGGLSELIIYSDSQYVVSQLNLDIIPKSSDFILICSQIKDLKKYLVVTAIWMPRSKNVRADQLAKKMRYLERETM